jgi:hypothetical protein
MAEGGERVKRAAAATSKNFTAAVRLLQWIRRIDLLHQIVPVDKNKYTFTVTGKGTKMMDMILGVF